MDTELAASSGSPPRLAQLVLRLLWAPLAVLVVHRYAGAAWGHEPYVDPVIHTLGGLAVAHMLSIGIVNARRMIGELTPFGRDMMVFGLTAFVTLAWEIGEYFLSAYYHAHLQRSIVETMNKQSDERDAQTKLDAEGHPWWMTVGASVGAAVVGAAIGIVLGVSIR